MKASPMSEAYSETLSWVSDRLSFSNFNFIGLVCLFPYTLGISQYATVNRYILSLCAPGMIFALIVVFLLFKQALLFCCRKMGFNLPNAHTLKVQVLFSLVFVVYFSFFNALSLVISIFTCAKDPSDGEDRGLYDHFEDREDYEYMTTQHYESVQCYNSIEWHYMFIAAIVGAVILVVLPLIIFTILLRRYRNSLDDPDVIAWLGILYASYKPTDISNTTSRLRANYWHYFEIGYMIIRFPLAFGLVSLNFETTAWISNAAVLLLFLALAWIFLKLQPYTLGVENNAAFNSIIALLITLIFSLPLNALKQSKMFQKEDLVLSKFMSTTNMVLLVVNGGTIIMFIVLIIWYGRKHLKANIRSVIEFFVYCWNIFRKCKKENIEQDQQPCLEQ